MDPHSFIARAEAQRWLGIAEKLLMGHDLVGSKTFAIRARDSDPRLEAADQILAITDTLLAADKRVVANNGTQQPDYYAILQLVRFVQDTEHIASQYRRLALRLNPHQNRFPYSDQAFQLVNDAWAVLSNPMRKSMYDAELDFPPQQQMNPIGFNLEQHHHQQHHHHQQQHNFFSINHMGSGHEQELPEQPQTFQTRVQHQQQQLQQHNFLSQPNPVRPLPIREQEQLFQHRDQEQMFQPQVQPFQVTSVAQQQTRPSPQPPQPQPIQSPPPASPHPPFSWPQASPLSQSQHQPEPHKQKQNLQPQPQLEPLKQKQHLQPQPQLEPHKQKQHLQPQPKLEPHKQKQHLQPQSQSQPQPQPKPQPQHVQPQPQPQPQQHVQPQPQLQHHLQAQPLPQQQHPWEKNQQQQQPQQLPQERNQQQQQPQQLPHKQNQQQPQQQQELPQVRSQPQPQPQPQPQQLHQEKSPQQLEPQQRPQEQPHQPLTRNQRQQQEQQQQEQQESLEKNDSPVQLPSQVTGNNCVRDEEVEMDTEAAAENVDDSPTFWTACPYCFYMFEYPKVYAECTLRCDNCKRAFQAVSVPSPPAIIEGQEACFYCWGFFPLGVSMSHLEKNNGKGTSSSWTPFSPLYDTSSNAQDHLNGRAAPKEKIFVHKNSGPRIHIDDITDDVFMGIPDSSDGSSDTEWDSTRENKVKRMKKGLEQGYKKRKQVLAVRARDTRNGSVKDLQHATVEEGVGVPVPVTETNKKAVGSNPPRRQSGRIAKELGKLDLNVEFNHNEGEEAAPRLSVGNRGHGQGDEDNIEGIGFFEGLDEFLSSLPILSVVNDEKVKAT